MANRIIKESLCSSERIASLSDFEFRLWIGLITQVDDAGRGDARPAVIKGHVFPLRDRVTVKDIDAALLALAAKGCVSLYSVDGKPYFWFPTWVKHQRIRNCVPKYPDPDFCGELPQAAASCGELRRVAASCGELRPNPIQSNPIQSNTIQSESNTTTRIRAFDEFWNTYPKKVGKEAARKAFDKAIKKTDVQNMVAAVSRQKTSDQWSRDNGQYIPNPATWLNQGRWEDVIPAKKAESPPPDDFGGRKWL